MPGVGRMGARGYTSWARNGIRRAYARKALPSESSLSTSSASLLCATSPRSLLRLGSQHLRYCSVRQSILMPTQKKMAVPPPVTTALVLVFHRVVNRRSTRTSAKQSPNSSLAMRRNAGKYAWRGYETRSVRTGASPRSETVSVGGTTAFRTTTVGELVQGRASVVTGRGRVVGTTAACETASERGGGQIGVNRWQMRQLTAQSSYSIEMGMHS